jgi:hypothetical protein
LSQAAVGTFDEGLVRALSESLSEPDWLREFRLKALGEFSSLPLEKNPLYTKYASISSFDLAKFGMVPGKTTADFRSLFSGFLTGRESNIILQGN